MTKKDKVKQLILNYENGQVSFEETQRSIEKIINKKIDQYTLDYYYGSEDLDNLCRRLTIDSIKNWKELTDEDALKLIEEILENVSRDDIFLRNSEALEKRYRKSTGTISDFIFWSETEMKPSEILSKLKEDSITYL